MFTTFFVKPIFNLLVLIYALLPAHNLGLAIILFTVLVRMLMWPLVRRQMNHTKALRELQPELKKIKKATKGDRQKESAMVMELYKEREVNMLAPFAILAVQLPILLGLYYGLKRVIDDPQNIIKFSYSWLHDLPWLKELELDISKFDNTLFGVVDLTRAALPSGGDIFVTLSNTYWPAMILVVGSAAIQYFQSKQLMPQDDKARSLRQIIKDASSGTEPPREEVTAATNRMMRIFVPVMVFVFTVKIPSMLSLYWLVGGLVAYAQQRYMLGRDTEDLEHLTDKPVVGKLPPKKRREEAIEAEIVKKAPREEVKIAKSGVKVTISRPTAEDATDTKQTSAARKKQKRKRRKT